MRYRNGRVYNLMRAFVRKGRMMQNYRECFGCHDCDHVFVKQEFDEPDQHFCHLDEVVEDHDFESAIAEWSEWADIHKVAPWGICDKFSKSPAS